MFASCVGYYYSDTTDTSIARTAAFEGNKNVTAADTQGRLYKTRNKRHAFLSDGKRENNAW